MSEDSRPEPAQTAAPSGRPHDERPVRIAVVGAGSWGTAFATHLIAGGSRTTLLSRRPEQAEAMRSARRNPDYLPDLVLPPSLEVGVYPGHDFTKTDLLVMAVPSKGYEAAAVLLAPRLPAGICVLSLTKGIEPESLRRLSQVLERLWGHLSPRVAVLSGPNHAEEVSLGQPTATVVASTDISFATRLQRLISSDYFRAYVNTDLIGVEFAGAVKNVIALATGMSDGVGYGDNARAALITRGLAEMARLGEALGASRLTFAGLAGMGDLVATCTSRYSRNRWAGELIAQGHDPAHVEEEMGMVAEGLTAAPAILKLAHSLDIEMPITENVVAIVYEGKGVVESMHDLMARQHRLETH